MTNTITHYLTTADKFLLSSTKFWSTLSTVATIAAYFSFYTTQEFTNTFTNSGKYICAFIIALHFIIFLSDPEKLKDTTAPFFPGSAMKWSLRFTAMRAIYLLYCVPEESVVGLIFVICVWIDILAITRIIKPEIDLWATNSVFMAVGTRSYDLYGFTAHHWLVILICCPLLYMQIRLESYPNVETKEKEG